MVDIFAASALLFHPFNCENVMAKDPAFLFYTNDFERGVQFFSDEQVGKYLRLLMAQHQHGHLEEKHMIFICKSYDKDIFSKFVQDSDGRWYNERLELEANKRKKFVESRSNNKSGKKIISTSYENHMENDNENEIVIKKEKRKGVVGEKQKFNPLDHIPENWNGDLFIAEWDDFMQMRKRKKWACTESVLTKRLLQLIALSNRKWEAAIEIMQKSTERGYAEFFPVSYKSESSNTDYSQPEINGKKNERVTIFDQP